MAVVLGPRSAQRAPAAVSIASEPVADALEILILLAPATKVGSLGDATRAKSLRWARMCYDHLAGMVGVSVTEALLERGLSASATAATW